MSEQAPQPITHLTPDPTAQQPEAKQRWFTLDFTPLRDSREFRLLYFSQSITFFGSMMTFVALPWQVFQLTNSSFAVGMLGVVEFVAVLFMGFVGGALADYLDRRLMVRLTEASLAAGSVVLIINALLPRPQVTAFAFHLYGGEGGLVIIADILDELSVRAFAPGTESGLFELDRTTEAFLRSREYLNQIVNL